MIKLDFFKLKNHLYYLFRKSKFLKTKTFVKKYFFYIVDSKRLRENRPNFSRFSQNSYTFYTRIDFRIHTRRHFLAPDPFIYIFILVVYGQVAKRRKVFVTTAMISRRKRSTIILLPTDVKF